MRTPADRAPSERASEGQMSQMSESQRQSIPDGTYITQNNMTGADCMNYGNRIISYICRII